MDHLDVGRRVFCLDALDIPHTTGRGRALHARPMNGTRRFPRARVRLEAEIWGQAEGSAARIRGLVTALNPGGAFVALERNYPPGSVVELRFKLPSSAERIEGTAVVRYGRKDKGIGVEFLEMSDRHRRQIMDLVTRRTHR